MTTKNDIRTLIGISNTISTKIDYFKNVLIPAYGNMRIDDILKLLERQHNKYEKLINDAFDEYKK